MECEETSVSNARRISLVLGIYGNEKIYVTTPETYNYDTKLCRNSNLVFIFKLKIISITVLITNKAQNVTINPVTLIAVSIYV